MIENEINDHINFRLDSGRQYSEIISNDANVKCVFISGSVGRGHADQYSDIEINIVWNQLPSQFIRERAIIESGGIDFTLFPSSRDSSFDEFYIGRKSKEKFGSGLLIEIIHHNLNSFESTISNVIIHHDTDLEKQALLSAIDLGIVLYGNEYFNDIKEKIKYSSEFQFKIINENIRISHFWKLKMLIERNKILFPYYSFLIPVYNQLLLLLLAINKQYYYGVKWIDHMINNLEIKPDNFFERSYAIFNNNSKDSVKELYLLIIDVYELIKKMELIDDLDKYLSILQYERFPN